jgi:hypothetical protein
MRRREFVATKVLLRCMMVAAKDDVDECCGLLIVCLDIVAVFACVW